MDFQKLLQQAKVKQTVVEKKLVQQKTQKEEEIWQKKRIEFQKQKEASLKLKRLKRESAKKQLEYKGLHRPSQALPSSSHNGNKTHTSHPSLPSNGKGQSSTSKGKPTPSKTKTTQSQDKVTNGDQASSFTKPKKLPVSSRSGDRLVRPKSQKSNSHNSVPCSSKSKAISQTPTAKPSQSKAQVVKFDDLMKMAAVNKNSGEGKVQKATNGKIVNPHCQVSSPVGKSLVEKHCQVSSPVGKSLVEKISGRTKGTKRARDEMSSNHSGSLSKSIDLTNSVPNRAHHSPPSASSTGKLVTDVRQQAPGHLSTAKTSPSKSGNTSHQQRSQSAIIKNNQSQRVGRGDPDRTLKAPTNASRNVRERLKTTSSSQTANSRPRPKPKPKSVEAGAFYGSAAARILRLKDKSSGSGPLRYTSCWVDEMKDVFGNSEDFEDYSEDDDLDGFVVGSDDDFIDDTEAGDYSSHIREIFGYDKRKFSGENFDDRLMESSYAQQEFEEARSARIGKQEDDEDIHKEQEELRSKKKRKPNPRVTSNGSRNRLGPKKSKISFR